MLELRTHKTKLASDKRAHITTKNEIMPNRNTYGNI